LVKKILVRENKTSGHYEYKYSGTQLEYLGMIQSLVNTRAGKKS